MYKIILIDDDITTIEGIKRHIPLSDMGIELVDVAYNGKDGLEAIKKHRPDIIFSDIEMPLMAGFDMIDCMREASLSPQIIILTGYSDFDHAKLAINANVSSYLVKPTTPYEIIDALKKAVAACDARKEAHTAIERQIIENLLHGCNYSIEDFKGFEKQYSINLFNKYFCCFFVSFNKITAEEKQSIIDLFYSVFSDGYDIYNNVISDKTVCFLLVSQSSFTQQNVEDIIKSKDISQADIFITIGTVSDSAENIPLSYKQALHMQEYSFCFDNKGCISFDYASSAFSQYRKKPLMLDKAVLNSAVISANIHLLTDIIDKLEESLKKAVIYDTLKIKTLAFEFCSAVVYQDSSAPVKSNDSEQNDMWLEIKSTTSHSELFEYCRNIISDFHEASQINDPNSEKNIINMMIRYVEENYMNSISLVSLSRQLYSSRNYLRVIFKKHFGIDFKTYVQNFRMKKAEELLLANQYNLSVIAEKVGYRDIKTFRTVFAKHYGMLPSEYKQNSHT